MPCLQSRGIACLRVVTGSFICSNTLLKDMRGKLFFKLDDSFWLGKERLYYM